MKSRHLHVLVAALSLSGCAQPDQEPGIGSLFTRTGTTLKSGANWVADRIQSGDVLTIICPGGFVVRLGDFTNRPLMDAPVPPLAMPANPPVAK